MNRIRLLPEQLANQIAAGEVVERPASVVKELVENALDAKATRIHVEIQAGGRSLIRITDDGVGMSKDDALLCLERHATSKIKTSDDLGAIITMGFRGEALPSIASVSRMSLITRERESEAISATQILLNGGKILAVKEASGNAGTDIEVRQLFFNVPARRKFLRSEETERAHIQHYLTVAALAFPEVAFSLQQDGKLLWQLPGVTIREEASGQLTGLKERLRALYGSDLNLLAVDASAEVEAAADENEEASEPHASLRIWGFIGAPGLSRSTRQDQHLFVNRRPVENRGLNFALMEGYHTALMKGRFPVCCLFLEIDPGEVDVNIHPAKREVKFRHESAVRRFVADAVHQTLLNFHGSNAQEERPTKTAPETGMVALPASPASNVEKLRAPLAAVLDFPALALQRKTTTPNRQGVTSAPAAPAGQIAASPGIQPEVLQPQPAIPTLPRSTPQAEPLLSVPLRLIGVVGKLYVLLESDRGLVLLDQHAAHERILYEQMLARSEQTNAPSQRLLLPETIELPPRDAQFLKEQLTILTRLGLGLSEFGERTFLLDGLPPFVKVTDARKFVLDLVDELKAAGREVNSWRLGEQTVAKTVCRHAVKANDVLAGPELENLVNDLRHCAMPYTCPHGRPTLIEMNFRELEKKFGRIQ